MYTNKKGKLLTEAISNRTRKLAEIKARKGREAVAQKVQKLVADLHHAESEGFSICNLCPLFSLRPEEVGDKPCYLLAHGKEPEKGFCTAFEAPEGVTTSDNGETVNFSGAFLKRVTAMAPT